MKKLALVLLVTLSAPAMAQYVSPYDEQARQQQLIKQGQQLQQLREQQRVMEAQQRQLDQLKRHQDQILQHGAGSCTPNFATGGCL